jgi:glycosyltransferase involved in cell wall biosynthesis
MNVSVLVCTHGDRAWSERAQEAALTAQAADETVVRHEDDATLAQVRNVAAQTATGDWLCFLDADDELDPGYLDAMRKTMRMWNLSRRGDLISNPLLLVPAVQYLRPGWIERSHPVIPDWDRLLVDLNCAVIGTLVPRLLFKEVGGFREWPMYEDWDLWLRCVRAGARLVPVPDAVYRARVSPDSRNQQKHTLRASTYEAIRAEHADVEPGWWRGAKVQT